MKTSSWNKEGLWYPGFLLAAVTGLATALVLSANLFTAPTIALRNTEDQLDGLRQVLPETWVNVALVDGQFEVPWQESTFIIFPSHDTQGQLRGYAIQGASAGYSGDIVVLVGVNSAFEITGVRVLSHNETPGLGDKIEIAKSLWITGFNRHSLSTLLPRQWAVKKEGGEFDQFTGATITPKAVIKQVHETLLMLETLEQEESTHE